VAKVRVYELAKELGMESKVVLVKLQELGEFVRSASSTVEPPVVRKMRELYPAAAPIETPEKKAPAKSAAKKAAASESPVLSPRQVFRVFRLFQRYRARARRSCQHLRWCPKTLASFLKFLRRRLLNWGARLGQETTRSLHQPRQGVFRRVQAAVPFAREIIHSQPQAFRVHHLVPRHQRCDLARPDRVDRVRQVVAQ